MSIMVDYARTAVFSGAGLSAGKPAALPLGWAFRDLLLDLCHEEAHLVSPAVADAATLHDLKKGTYKLEVVLGRIAGTVGAPALDLLEALNLTVPNESHMLGALALAHGGTHVTVNLDEGLELAYQILTGKTPLPVGTDRALQSALPLWQALVPANCPQLSVIASHAEFEAWARKCSPATLLKIHGSIRTIHDRVMIIDPVVVDDLEYAGLTVARLSALDALATASRVIITGYSGLDIDVYDPLLERLTSLEVIWAAPDVWPRVRSDLATLPRARIQDGTPTGLANTALRNLFGWAAAPIWPEIDPPAPIFADRAASCMTAFRARAAAGTRAEAYAWFLADIGRYDAAQKLLDELHAWIGRQPGVQLRNRLADVLYDRHQPGDRRAAVRMWAQIISDRSASRAQRAYACTRIGEIGRGVAIRGPVPLRPVGLATSVGGPLAALALTRNGRVEPGQAARALSAISGLGLRLLESLPPRQLLRARLLTRWLARGADAAGRRAQTLDPGGNRLLVIRQQRNELALMIHLLSRGSASHAIIVDLKRIGTAYERADDLRGQANIAAALALAAITNRDSHSAKKLLDKAENLYTHGRPGQPADPSGLALVARRRNLARCYGLIV
jgi:hypothetical protein